MMKLISKVVSNENDLLQFRQAVQSAGLPQSDLGLDGQLLILFFDESTFIGTGGLELLKNAGLLRSICTVPEHRNKSYGKQIVRTMLNHAETNNLSNVYLLTETAGSYFKQLGFAEIDRGQVPQEIKSTSEFASVCPTSATCMAIQLKK